MYSSCTFEVHTCHWRHYTHTDGSQPRVHDGIILIAINEDDDIMLGSLLQCESLVAVQ